MADFGIPCGRRRSGEDRVLALQIPFTDHWKSSPGKAGENTGLT